MTALPYSSSLHYILLQPEDSSFKSVDFFLHFVNEDICKLDISLSELKLRTAFNKKIGIFYDNNSILHRSELQRLVKRNISLTRCKLDFKLSGKSLIRFEIYKHLFLPSIYFISTDTAEDLPLMTRLVGLSPQLSELTGRCIPNTILRALGWLGGEYLTTLVLGEVCALDGAKYTDDTFDVICRAYPHLTRLRVDEDIDYPGLTDASIRSVVTHCPKLESLTINWENITDAAMDALLSMSTLKELNLSCYHSITGAGIRRAIEANRDLESITVSSHAAIDDNLLRSISLNFPKLKTLYLYVGEECDEISSDSMFIAITKRCPLLETLQIDGWEFKDDLLLSLSQHCPKLRRLQVGWEADELTQQSVVTEAALIQLFQGCPDLRAIRTLPTTATDASLLALSTYCTHFEEICIWHNNHIRDTGLVSLFKACNNLATVRVDGCSNITDQSLFSLVQHCPLVAAVTLSGQRLTDTSLLYIATHLRKLHKLSVSFMSMPDDILSIISRRCKFLTDIDFYHCSEITSTGILSIINKCRRLKRVFVYECDVVITPELHKYTRGGDHITRELYVRVAN